MARRRDDETVVEGEGVVALDGAGQPLPEVTESAPKKDGNVHGDVYLVDVGCVRLVVRNVPDQGLVQTIRSKVADKILSLPGGSKIDVKAAMDVSPSKEEYLDLTADYGLKVAPEIVVALKQAIIESVKDVCPVKDGDK